MGDSKPTSRRSLNLTPQSVGAHRTGQLRLWTLLFSVGASLATLQLSAAVNLLQNPGFEAGAAHAVNPPGWTTEADGPAKIQLSSQAAHNGRQGIVIPAHSAVAQQIQPVPAGAYLARGWVKSPVAQRVTFLVENAARPWEGYSCSSLSLPAGRWVPVQVFCALERPGRLTLMLGGMTQQFRSYHGTGEDTQSAFVADDFELVRCQPSTQPHLALWDAPVNTTVPSAWSTKDQWAKVQDQAHTFGGAPVFQARQLVGVVRPSDGELVVYALKGGTLQPRGDIVPSVAFNGAKCALTVANGRTGIVVSAGNGDQSYTAWLLPTGVIRIEAHHVPRFQVRQCQLRYGLLPSFVGTDIEYDPTALPRVSSVSIPSTQWFVGLREGHDSMLVAVWDSQSQAVSLGLNGAGERRHIATLSINTEQGGFALSYVEHRNLWHQETLQDDWLEAYAPINWQRPFPARWMAHCLVTPGGTPSFREPDMEYSFPIADAKTRLWGVWFEDWNHYPFYFDGSQTMFHFEKSFVPTGRALIYFLEPAAADLYSPCEIVEQVLGKAKAQALFDFGANQLRKLKYSTPDKFMYDRPVCATTTHLSHIPHAEKATVGINLATHLYEFIRDIRTRVNEYSAYFAQLRTELNHDASANPALRDYVAPLEAMVTEAQAQARRIYATPLALAKTRTEAMKVRLRQGQGDGFNCGNLDVRGIAGAQDDLTRRDDRLVLRLYQVAAQTCGDSPAKAAIATKIWDESRAILRRPCRWEPRRTLYFFEP